MHMHPSIMAWGMTGIMYICIDECMPGVCLCVSVCVHASECSVCIIMITIILGWNL